MRIATGTLLIAFSLAGCARGLTGDSQEELARQRFGEFQSALFRSDPVALRGLLCSDARPAIEAMCNQPRASQRPLEVTGVTKRNYEFLVHVRDPNRGGRESDFVLTVENGEMRIDLRATARANSEEKRTFLGEERFVPQKLTEEQVERARVVGVPAPASASRGR